MYKVNKAIIVEGKYDKIKLSNIFDALIIETNGFSLFNNKENLEYIKKIAEEQGIVILTDSDHAGFMIRNYLNKYIDSKYIDNIYIRDNYGKEKRKKKPSSENKLGVEGMEDQYLVDLFIKHNLLNENLEKNIKDEIKKCHLYEFGLYGKENSKEKRNELLKVLELPEFISNNSLIKYLNQQYSLNEFVELMKNLKNN